MTMSDVFGEQPEERVVQAATGLAERPDTRPVINLASGVRWERLTHERDPDVEFLYVIYPVGAASCPEDALMTHGGREYGYVTSGTLGVQVGSRCTSSVPAGRSLSTRRPRTGCGPSARSLSTPSGSSSDARRIRGRRRCPARAPRTSRASTCGRVALALEAADSGSTGPEASEQLGLWYRMSANRISTPMVIWEYSVGWWNSGSTLSTSERNSAASSAPTNDPRPPARLAPPQDGRGRCSRARSCR